MRRTSEATRVIFGDPASRAFEERLALLAPTDSPVLITGETGTGKEVAAQELHTSSGRRGPFLAVNCGALTETLAEAELFGHEKGAFTGAVKSQPGWFEAASGGTLLLDEIGEMPLAIQAKLLRVLQQREVTRVGSRTPRPIDVRVVAATNIDLAAAVAGGRFRRDLLFRLNVATVALRPLREHRQDIAPLAQHFLSIYNARFGRAQAFSADALAALRDHAWPGNIRELDNVVHRAALLTAGATIEAADLSLDHVAPGAATGAALAPPGTADEPEPGGLEASLRRLAERWMRDGEPDLLRRTTQVLVQASFEAAGNNQVKAAEVLGVSRNTLRTRLGHLGVIAPRRRVPDSAAGWVRARIGTQRFGMSSLLRLGGDLERRLAMQRILVDWHEFATGPLLIAALQAGEIDFGSTGEMPPVFAQASGVPLVYLAYESPAPASVALVVRRADGPGGVADLAGHRVALSHGANAHLLLLRALQAHGLSMADIDPVCTPPRLACSPAATEDADAWMMWDPFLTEVQRGGQHRVLMDGTGLVANHRFYLARRAFAEAMPDVVDTMLDEARRVGARAAARPAAAARDLASSFGMVPDAMETVVRRLAGYAKPLDARIIGDQQLIADQLHGWGFLPRAIRVADAVWR